MSKATKSAWLYLAAGLLFLFSVARDIWAPGFLSISGRHHNDVWMRVVSGALFLGAACLQFMRMRRVTR